MRLFLTILIALLKNIEQSTSVASVEYAKNKVLFKDLVHDRYNQQGSFLLLLRLLGPFQVVTCNTLHLLL